MIRTRTNMPRRLSGIREEMIANVSSYNAPLAASGNLQTMKLEWLLANTHPDDRPGFQRRLMN